MEHNLMNDGRKVEQVFSAGDSWIVCRSKSHPGRVYYFNTLTGKAAWNLSESEIEKAKRATKNLSNQEGVAIVDCPEPKDPPTDNHREDSSIERPYGSTSKIYNKQIINNQFSKPAFPINPLVVAPCNQFLSTSINSLIPVNMNSPNPGYNTHIWAVPPTPQFYIAPTVPRLNNQSETAFALQSENVSYNSGSQKITVQHTDTSLSSRFQNFGPSNRDSPQACFVQKKKFTPRSESHRGRTGKNNFQRNFKRRLSNNDLRNLLSAKKTQRKFHYSESEESTHDNADQINTFVQPQSTETLGSQKVEEPQKENDDYLDTDSDWIEENIIVDGNKLKLNVTNLKKLADPNSKAEYWYIVPDKDILLNHLNFLNILYSSDDSCRLMVPTRVLEELRALEHGGATPARLARRARRAVAFLTPLLDCSDAISGEGAYKEVDTRCEYLLDCCVTLLQQNYHVVLLSNDTELKTLEKETRIPLFNVTEIKHFLTKPNEEFAPVLSSSQLPIKITIPNDLHDKPCENMSPELESKVDTNPHNEYEVIKNEDGIIPNDQVAQFKQKTVEASVQTDVEILPLKTGHVSSKNTELHPSRDGNKDTVVIPREKTNFDNLTSNKTQVSNRREIRLNRSTSNITSSSEETSAKKKQFKWRKRRNASNSVSKNVISDVGNFNDEKDMPAVTCDNNTSCTQTELSSVVVTTAVNRDSVENSETSSSIHRPNISDRIIIEETSTSDIISNTISNVDSFSESGKGDQKCNSDEKNKKILSPNKMIEVKDQTMEDYLKMRCDEWVSRFLQIMEEVLTQVMQRDKQFLHNIVYERYGGGPWMIPEECECIKIKFQDNPNIVDAAHKLKTIYLKVSDTAGRINAHIQPREYMEMFSYGVYLVDVLQEICSDCEDIRTAAHSMSNLLNDIQNPSLDTSHQDPFGDHHQECMDTVDHSNLLKTQEKLLEKVHSPPKSPVLTPKLLRRNMPRNITPSVSPKSTAGLSQQKTPIPSPKKTPCSSPKTMTNSRKNITNISPQKVGVSPPPKHKELITDEKTGYNLRSSIKEPAEVNIQQQNVKFIRNIDIEDTFFLSLHLKKKSAEETYNAPLKKTETSKSINDDIKDNNEPKIVRNFTVIPMYDNNLKQVQRKPLDMNDLDYSQSYDDENDYVDDEYETYSGEEYYDNEDDIQELKTSTEADLNELHESDLGVENYQTTLDDHRMSLNNNFIFNQILSEIKETFLDINTFCESAALELADPVYSNNKKIKILDKAGRVHTVVQNLSKSLIGIYNRERYEPENSIESVLIMAGFKDFDLGDLKFKEYRDIISRCIDRAKDLLDSVSLIITVANKKPVREF